MLKVDREGIEFRYKEALVFDDSTPHRLRMGRSAVLNYTVKQLGYASLSQRNGAEHMPEAKIPKRSST